MASPSGEGGGGIEPALVNLSTCFVRTRGTLGCSWCFVASTGLLSGFTAILTGRGKLANLFLGVRVGQLAPGLIG